MHCAHSIKPYQRPLVLALMALVLALVAHAHPVPDVPVHSLFEPDRTSLIRVEIDPRCFAAEHDTAPYFFRREFEKLTQEQRSGMLETAREFLKSTVEFRFEPGGVFAPQFGFDFERKPGEAFESEDDVMIIQAGAAFKIPSDAQGYRVRARPEGKLSVLVLNRLGGQAIGRVHVLFPGETSYRLDLGNLALVAPSASSAGQVERDATVADRWLTLLNFVRQGFVHVLPLGWDHILFVLGLFLLSREWRPLLWQVSAFTVAHTITLGMATLGLVSVPPALVEPVIAASIAVVALENIYRPRYTRWRLLVVFVFGLVHGLGFASALRELDLPPALLVLGLLGFNVGVELGQLAIIALACAVTVWLRKPERYRKYVVIPGSAVIAVVGLWWTLDRIFR